MPTEIEALDGTQAMRMLSWKNDYDVKDGQVLQRVVEEHLERHGIETAIIEGDSMLFSFPDDGHWNRYRVTAKGEIISGFKARPSPDATKSERQRHETITSSRMTALVGRANKVIEFIDYVEAFDEHDVAETVFETYCSGPVLDGAELEKAVIEEHGVGKRDAIYEQGDWYLFRRAGVADIPDDAYRDVVDRVAGDDAYDAALPEATKIDFEILTKTKRMADVYSRDWKTRHEMNSIYYNVLETAAEELGMKHILDRREYQFRYGNWPG